jgi:GTP-binding protein
MPVSCPTVALVGRPNVGKSTLFNRLLHRRRAITSPIPGVTRDPVVADAYIGGAALRLIDTGGFKLDRRKYDDEIYQSRPGAGVKKYDDADMLDDLVLERTWETIKNADVIVLIFEAGVLTLEDEEFIDKLRPFQNKLIAVVNKTEGGRRESEAWNLLSYGFSEVFMISAEHGDNIALLEAAIAKRVQAINNPDASIGVCRFGKEWDCGSNTQDSAASCGVLDPCPAIELPAGTAPGLEMPRGDIPIRIALLGKPNTGKSTLSNYLTSSEASIVSPVPGTTRDVVEGRFYFQGSSFRLLDTAGIRRKTSVKEDIEYYSVNRAIQAIDDADIVFLLIDAAEGLSEQDKKIAALACDKGRGVILVLNKWDVMPQMKNTFEAVSDRIRFMFPKMDYAPLLALSAKTGEGIEKALQTALRMYKQLTRHIETAVLNEALARWMEETPPPSGPQTRFKVKYAVQASANPLRFILFVSRPGALTESYLSYLRNRLRKDLGFSMVPIQLEVRASRKPKSELHGKTERKHAK